MKRIAAFGIICWFIPLPQTTRQPSKGVSEKQGSPNREQAKDAAEKKDSTDTETLKAILAAVTKDQQERAESQKQETTDKKETINAEWWLVYVGIAQALALIGTLVAIWYQAQKTKIAAEATRDAANATQNSVIAIQQQVSLMERQTAAEDTAKAANDNAIAAKEGAEAANKNIEVFISKERAKLVVDLQKLKFVPRPFFVYTVDFTVSIYGATAAYITETGCAAYFGSLESVCDSETGTAVISSLSTLPRVISPNVAPTEQFAIWRFGEQHAQEIISDIKNDKLFVGVRAFIKYKDVFDRIRETRFRYVWKFSTLFPVTVGERYGDWEPCGDAEDNKET